MLQQTQVDRVLPKYAEWLEKYPSLEALAAAAESDVAQTWRPLGYNIRPKRLHAIARESMARYGGQLPSDEETLLSFKGIGEYTAGAVLSFAFGQRAAILDTNVARVLFRNFVGRGDLKSHAMKRHLWDVSRAVLPQRHVFDFNQALMDFGATLCTARSPKCLICPMRRQCAAFPFNPEHERVGR
jgi:A/G-specific adenine glycosylase